ncbi:MAG: DNA repair protein RecO [Clostridia bacterium]|nr:DNA repair protein RecO [Clostridia bacterium]
MEELSTRGLVIHETQIGEYDKILTVLTPDAGKISISGKGIKSLRSRHMAATQLFSYSHFQLRKRGNYYYIDDSDLIENFYAIRSDLLKFSLASYICDVANDVTVENEDESELLRLILNTLYAIDKSLKDLELIRGAFQLRVACICGFMPDLSGCRDCHDPNPTHATLDILDGNLICDKCRKRIDSDFIDERGDFLRPVVYLDPALRSAMQYVTLARLERFLSFAIDDDVIDPFATCCEKYLLNHIERGFYSLDFYKSIL